MRRIPIVNEHKFIVEDHEFSFPADFTEQSKFTIQSSPRSYTFEFDNSLTPAEQIEVILSCGSSNVLIADEKVFRLHLDRLSKYKDRIKLIPAAEDFKTINGVLEIVSFLEERNITKRSDIIVAGGGITQDISGFACAIYKRGLPWTLFPTTLLSMCDSCIGGKTAVNHNKVKNQLGLFAAPYKVVVNPAFIDTLEDKEITSGLGEILKLFAIAGKEMLILFDRLTDGGKVKDKKDFKKLILGAIQIKKAVIEFDEFEKRYRRSLNYGHTIGHAIETLTDYAIAHGQAVVIGMSAIDSLSRKYGKLSEEDFLTLKRMEMNLLRNEKYTEIPLNGLFNLLQKDKKTTGQTLNFASLDSPGNIQILSLPLNEELIEEIKMIIKNMEFLK